MERIHQLLGGVVETQRHFMTFIVDIRAGQSRLENGQDQLHDVALHLLTATSQLSQQVEDLQAEMAEKDERPATRIVDKLIEWGPKVASNWAPISAALAAMWKWGVPYLRQWLGSP
jgi:hypothetical protein